VYNDDMDEQCTAQMADNVNLWTRIRLAFKPFRTHLSHDGFVLYKKVGSVLYIYAHGHFVFDEEYKNNQRYEGGTSSHWSN
jgi:hypothetical protein